MKIEDRGWRMEDEGREIENCKSKIANLKIENLRDWRFEDWKLVDENTYRGIENKNTRFSIFPFCNFQFAIFNSQFSIPYPPSSILYPRKAGMR
jgi:hypothetical protein